MTDPEVIERRLSVYAGDVLAATEHGWPLDYFVGGEKGNAARHMVKMLVDAHINPPYQADNESSEEYKARRQSAESQVFAELDAKEAAFMGADIDETAPPEVIGEHLQRFGRRAVHETEE